MKGAMWTVAGLAVLAGVALYLRLRQTDRRLVKTGLWDVCLWGSLVMFTLAAAYGIWSEVSKMLPK